MNRVEEIAEALLGTCNSMLEAGATQEEENDVAFCEELDEKVFQCEGCSWWFEGGYQHVVHGQNYCDDCIEPGVGEEI